MQTCEYIYIYIYIYHIWMYIYIYIYIYIYKMIQIYNVCTYIYIYIERERETLWFGWALWHINHYRLFSNKSSLYIYIEYMICKHILQTTFSNVPELIFFLHTVNRFHLLQSNGNNSILQLIIGFYTVKCFQVLSLNINKSIKHHSFVYRLLNDQTVLFQTNQFKASPFVYTHFIKHFFLTYRWDPIRCYHPGPEWTWE